MRVVGTGDRHGQAYEGLSLKSIAEMKNVEITEL